MSQPLAKIQTEKGVPLQTSDAPIRVIGFIILFVTFGIFGGWAAFAPLDSAALAPGVVTVKGYRKTVQHLEGGIVKDIHVRDGQRVKKGDLLLVLDSTQARAQLGVLRGQYISARATEARLLAERQGLDQVKYPAEFLALEDPRVTEAIDNQNQVFQARVNAYRGEVSVLNQRKEQLREQIQGLEAVIDNKQQRVASFEEQIEEQRELLTDGYADKLRLRDLERNHSRLLGEIAEHRAEVARTRTQIGETDLEILQLKKEIQSEVANKLTEVQAQLFDLRERMVAVEDTVRRTQVTAPEAGMIFNLAVHTLGAVVKPGTPILEIVPQTEELIVEARVAPVDIDRVEPGQVADVRFSAFKSATTPVSEGRLLSLSADRLVDEKSGEAYYLARVELTEKGRRLIGDRQLLPGMPAEVLIKTGGRTLLEYIVQPATNAFARSLIED